MWIDLLLQTIYDPDGGEGEEEIVCKQRRDRRGETEEQEILCTNEGENAGEIEGEIAIYQQWEIVRVPK